MIRKKLHISILELYKAYEKTPNEGTWGALIDGIEMKDVGDRLKYFQALMSWAARREFALSDRVPTSEWFEIRNRIRTLRKKIIHSKRTAHLKIGYYRLKINDDGLYQIHSERDGAFEGGFSSIMKKAIEMGIKVDEFKLAHNSMKDKGHTVANFGMFGNFVYTSKK